MARQQRAGAVPVLRDGVAHRNRLSGLCVGADRGENERDGDCARLRRCAVQHCIPIRRVASDAGRNGDSMNRRTWFKALAAAAAGATITPVGPICTYYGVWQCGPITNLKITRVGYRYGRRTGSPPAYKI